MRRARMRAPGDVEVGYYHCVSRVVDRRRVLGEVEREHFVRLMRLYERLCGLRVVAYCVMSNHFHLLVEVPRRPAAGQLPDDAGLVALVAGSLGAAPARELEWELGRWRAEGAEAQAEALRERWFARMWDISAFMKVLKQRFSQWFNRRHGRCGTLWEGRFRSVLVEGRCNALRAMAGYIDLNPVRAGICEDPKDYRWSGYGEAVAGGRQAAAAVKWLALLDAKGGTLEAGQRPRNSREGLERWRCWLFGVPWSGPAREEQLERQRRGGEAAVFRRGIPRVRALEVLSSGGSLSRAEYLRCRVRYFCDGAALGSREFIEAVFAARRQHFGRRRRSGARPLRGLECEGSEARLYNLRDLRREAFG